MNLSKLKRWFVGTPIATAQAHHERLGPITGLAVFASDNISSSAYASEEIMRVFGQLHAQGQTVDCKHAIFIMTSNIGSTYLQADTMRTADEFAAASKLVMNALHGHFKPEFLNRVDDVIVFRPLGKEQLTHIVELQLEALRRLLAERKISVELTDAAKELVFTEGYDVQYGARPLKRALQRLVQDLLEISRYDAGVARLESDVEDLRAVVTNAVDASRALSERHGSELVVQMPDAPVRVEMDSRRVERILRNLLGNAIEHGDGRPVVITVRADEQAGAQAGVGGTPAFFINGRMTSGAQPFEKFKEIIDDEIAAKKTAS